MSHHPLFSLNAALAHGGCMLVGFILLNAGVKYARDARKHRALHLHQVKAGIADDTPQLGRTATNGDHTWDPVSAHEQPPWLHDHSLYMALCGIAWFIGISVPLWFSAVPPNFLSSVYHSVASVHAWVGYAILVLLLLQAISGETICHLFSSHSKNRNGTDNSSNNNTNGNNDASDANSSNGIRNRTGVATSSTSSATEASDAIPDDEDPTMPSIRKGHIAMGKSLYVLATVNVIGGMGLLYQIYSRS